jgi:predicted RNase H-like HicB family nuclease
MKEAKILTYTAVFERAPEGGYIVSVPSLPGCMSQGETFEEARENIKDAIAAYLEVLKEDNEEIPVERDSVTATVSVRAG